MRALFLVLIFISGLAKADDLDFSPVTPDMSDMRRLAPNKPNENPGGIALPQSGNDLESIGSDWARRQIHVSTNGADERLLNATNEKLDQWFGAKREPASLENQVGQATTPPEKESSWKPRTLHMSRLGEFEIGFVGDTKVTCDVVNGSELTVSKPLFQDIDLRLHHEATMNTVQVNISW